MNVRSNIYVAVVDDDESLGRSLSRLLRTSGFQTIAYPSGEAFLGDHKRPRFDCLVLDFQMEGMTGIELSRRLAAVNDTTPVVFITAQDDPAAQAEAEATGCAGYFRKADPGSVILAAIRSAIQKTPRTQPDLPNPTKTKERKTPWQP